MRLLTQALSSAVAVLFAAALSCGGDATSNSATSGGPGGSATPPTGDASVGSSGEPAPPAAGVSETVETEERMTFEGVERRFLLEKPTRYDGSKKYPLVLGFHGNPGTAESMRDVMPYHTVTKQEAIVVYPQATRDKSWQFSTPAEGNEDMPWIEALVAEVGKKVNIDPSRVLGFGYSGGAYFLGQYGCRVGGVLKMVAIVAGGAAEQKSGDTLRPENDCVVCPAGPVPTFIAHGELDDSAVPFAGGNYARMCSVATNECGESTTPGFGPCVSYQGCRQPVTWCPVPNQGHAAWQESMKASWDLFSALP